jgi:hypothetical protein
MRALLNGATISSISVVEFSRNVSAKMVIPTEDGRQQELRTLSSYKISVDNPGINSRTQEEVNGTERAYA